MIQLIQENGKGSTLQFRHYKPTQSYWFRWPQGALAEGGGRVGGLILAGPEVVFSKMGTLLSQSSPRSAAEHSI